MKELFVEIKKEQRMIFALAMVVFLVLQGISASVFSQQWTGPSATPPGGNIPEPIYGSSGKQDRSGALILNDDLIIKGRFGISGDYLDFGEGSKNIRQGAGFIIIGSSTPAGAFFKFFASTTHPHKGRFAIGAPASDTPPTNLYVAGTGFLDGATTIDGAFTMGSGANVCRMAAYSTTTGQECGDNHYVVGVTNTSFVVQNPQSPPETGYVICCKNAD